MEFKKLEIRQEGSRIKRILVSHKKTLIFIAVGAIGGFFGFFITNSPCARG